MRYLMGQFFLWGLGSCLCLMGFILIVALFDGQIDQLRLQLAIFHIYLWPFALGLGMALRVYLLKRRGEWLALQCMGWPPMRLLKAAVVAGGGLACVPFGLSMWGWHSVIGLEAEALEWIWTDEAVVRLRDGFVLSLSGERQMMAHSHLGFEVRWLSGWDCLKTAAGQIELQYRLLRFAASVLGATAGTLLVLTDRNHWLLFSAILMSLGLCIFPVLPVGFSWGALCALALGLYALGSRM